MKQDRETREVLLGRTVSEQTFGVVSPVLEPDEESEWLISDGSGVLRVVVEDDEFLRAVKDGRVVFTSGCSIVCELEVTQWMTGEGVRSEYRVRSVMEVIPPEEM